MECSNCRSVLGPLDTACPRCALPVPGRAQGVQTVSLPDGRVYKVCPQCSQPAALNLPGCLRCGFQYVQPASRPAQAGLPQGYASPYPARRAETPGMSLASRQRQNAMMVGILLGLITFLGVALVIVQFRARSGKRAGGGLSNLTVLGAGSGQGGSGLVSSGVDSGQIAQRLVGAGAVTGGEVEVSLAWNTLSDLDLQVREPSGELITAEHPTSQSGGVQDVDSNPTLLTMEGHMKTTLGQRVDPADVLTLPDFMVDLDEKMRQIGGMSGMFGGGSDGHAMGRFSRTPVEHIQFARAPGGIYTVYAHCYSWRENNRTPLPFTVEVRSRGKVIYQTTGTLGPDSYIMNLTTPTQVCQFQIR
jgi:hypothetical protein